MVKNRPRMKIDKVDSGYILPTHWITKDKKHIAIVDMGDEHIRNSINMLERNIKRKMDREKDFHNLGFDNDMTDYYSEIKALLCEDSILNMRLTQKALILERRERQKSIKTKL